MEIYKNKVQLTDKITLGGDKMVLFAGPCAAESFDITIEAFCADHSRGQAVSQSQIMS